MLAYWGKWRNIWPINIKRHWIALQWNVLSVFGVLVQVMTIGWGVKTPVCLSVHGLCPDDISVTKNVRWAIILVLSPFDLEAVTMNIFCHVGTMRKHQVLKDHMMALLSMYVKPDVTHNHDHMEATCSGVHIHPDTDIQVVGIYIHPSTPIDDILQGLSSIMNSLSSDTPVIQLGDFNVNIKEHSPAAKQLLAFHVSYRYKQVITDSYRSHILMQTTS